MIKNKLRIVILLAVLGGLVIASSFVNAQEDSQVGLEVGKTAPDFELSNLQEKQISLSDFRGQYVVLNFWATWCPPCRQEMPNLDKFHQENKEFTVVAVNIRDNKQRVEEFMKYNDYQFPVLLDQAAEVGSRYQVGVIPTTYFLDPQGRIEKIHRGALTTEQLNIVKKEIVESSQETNDE